AELPQPRTTVAGFAPSVTQAAEGGDDVAAHIVAAEAGYLAVAAEVACRRLGLGGRPRIGLAGGVLHGSPYVRGLLRDALGARGLTDAGGRNLFVLDGIACARHYALLADDRAAGAGNGELASLGAGLDGLEVRVPAPAR